MLLTSEVGYSRNLPAMLCFYYFNCILICYVIGTLMLLSKGLERYQFI